MDRWTIFRELPQEARWGIALVLAGGVVVPFMLWFGLLLIVAGVMFLLTWLWNYFRRNFLVISLPENGYVFSDADDNADNPICNSVVTVTLTTGATDVELIYFAILRVKDGLGCGLDHPKIQFDGGNWIYLSPDCGMKPVNLSAGSTHRISFYYEFFTPLQDLYRASDMKAGGEVSITLTDCVESRIERIPALHVMQ